MRFSFGFVFHFKLVKVSITFYNEKVQTERKNQNGQIYSHKSWAGCAVIFGIQLILCFKLLWMTSEDTFVLKSVLENTS